MHCPVCKTEMIIQELNQTEVDYCVDCQGIWLDQGELEMLLGSSSDDPLMQSFKPIQSEEHARKCPVCQIRMDKFQAGEGTSPILTDHCPKNHGIWFDSGELHHLLKISSIHHNSKLANLLREMFPHHP